MNDIVLITGKVKYSITLDPGVWIFDDRKKRLKEFFQIQDKPIDPLTAYQQKIGQQWDKELQEGSTPSADREKLFVQKKDISGDWGISFRPFLENASPLETASFVVCHLQSGDNIAIPLDQAKESILCFALDGQPIREQGPIHLLYKDGSNRHDPIKGIIYFELK